jgi:hypothetical protein
MHVSCDILHSDAVQACGWLNPEDGDSVFL